MEKRLTDNEIIKALECCSKKICKQCPNFSEDIECSEKLINLTLDYIARQLHELQERYEEAQTEIENLKVENQSLRSAANSLKMHYEETQAEIEKLNAENMLTISERNAFRTSFYDVLKQLKTVKTEAYKECIEKVRKLSVGMHPCSDELRVFDSDLDNLLKMVGEIK